MALASPSSAAVQLAQCPACFAPWLPSRQIRVRSVETGDAMLASGALRELGEYLTYGRCGACESLVAVDARRREGLLSEIYQALPEQYWSHLSTQDQFADTLESQLRQRNVAGELWDIGCGTGTLLTHLSGLWHKHGIEPGARAVGAAQAQGLDVRQGTALQLGLTDVADAALLIDVVEHLPAPASELEAVVRMLRPGGTLAVFTGDASAMSARLAGNWWYYLHCVGHVTIFSRQALVELLKQFGLINIESIRVEHQGAVSLRQWCGRAAGNAARLTLGRPAAPLHFYHDHQLVLATKPV